MAFLVFVAGLLLCPSTESDLFFRLKVGQEILATGAIPAQNLFSFTYPQHPDVDTAWLFEVLLAALFRLGGFPAIVVAKTAVVMGTFALAYWVCRRRGAGPLASVVVLVAALFVMRERLVERPHLFSLAGEVALLALLECLPRPTAPTARRQTLRVGAALLGVVVLWANLHAGAFLAPIILALTGGGALIDHHRRAALRRDAAEPPPAAAPLLIMAAGAVLALAATPVGPRIVRYLWLHLHLPRMHAVDEFRSPALISDGPLIVLGALVIAAAVVFRRRLPARVLLPVLGLGLMTCGWVRFGADFALLAAPVLAVALSFAAADRLNAKARALARFASPLAAVALVVAAVAPRAVAMARRQPFIHLGVDTSALPLAALAFMEQHGLRDRMYNDFEVGSYLAFADYPRHRVFVDPRMPAYPDEFHRLLGRFDLSRADWNAAMDRYQVDSALIAYAGVNRRAAWWDPEIWALVYRQDDARVFVRRLPRWTAFIAAHEIPATFRFSVETGAATVPIDEPPVTSPVADCVWRQRLGDLQFELAGEDTRFAARAEQAYRRALAAAPGCLPSDDEIRLAAWLGAVDLKAGRWKEALALLDRARDGDRGADDLATLTNRAIALESLRDNVAAAAAWDRVATRAAGTPLGQKALEHSRRWK
ncbi:MAG: hypothetical protein QOI66_1702 [Myxococcales bacterium]|nr:hypothetical protein [Myxococcales bacterium]